MIEETLKQECTGCYLCRDICPVGAIEMRESPEGFPQPCVAQDKCIQCKLCIKKCPPLNPYPAVNENDPVVYAAWNKNVGIRLDSTSGGVFTALAHCILLQGGVVIGAAYSETQQVSHCVIRSEGELEGIRQSKYVQSDLSTIYTLIKELIGEGSPVLFCGTPCHNAAVLSLFGGPQPNLYLCDFICRGVISPKVYRKYLHDLEKRYQSTVSKVWFKNKEFGWNRFSTKIKFADGQVYHKDRYHDLYMVGYLEHNLYLRPSCHHCHYKQLPRMSDITLGDFWGLRKVRADLDNNQGTSVVLLNSPKGKQLFDAVTEQIFSEERSLSEVAEGNACLLLNAQPGKGREFFFSHFDQYAFDTLVKKSGHSLLYRARKKGKKAMDYLRIKMSRAFSK